MELKNEDEQNKENQDDNSKQQSGEVNESSECIENGKENIISLKCKPSSIEDETEEKITDDDMELQCSTDSKNVLSNSANTNKRLSEPPCQESPPKCIKREEADGINECIDQHISKDETPTFTGNEDEKSTNITNPKNVKELTDYCSSSNRDETLFIASPVPEICKTQPCILGIDEAGRGPVLGPMVYGVCYCPKSKEDDLKETGCADSKSLTEEKREIIFNEICKHEEYIGWEVEVISPSIISSSMLRRQKVSLNEVSHNSAIGLLRRALDGGVRVTEVFVDTVGPAEKYEAKLKSLFPELEITVAKKADSTYPIVGGASICAKVTRDVAIKSWTFPGLNSAGEWGSGYPNDPVTKKFLKSNLDPIFGFPSIVRFSWSTAEKILEDSAVEVDWEEDGDSAAVIVPSVRSFFSPEDQKLHRYFRDRCLKNVVNL